jgi:hypothetical protein
MTLLTKTVAFGTFSDIVVILPVLVLRPPPGPARLIEMRVKSSDDDHMIL